MAPQGTAAYDGLTDLPPLVERGWDWRPCSPLTLRSCAACRSRWASGYVAPNPAAAAAFLFAEGVVLLTFVLLLSTRLSTLAAGVIGVALFGVAWLAGVVGSLGTAFNIRALHTASEISQYLLPTDGLWHGAIYYLEPSSFVTQQLAGPPEAQGDPFFASAAPPWPYLTWAGIWLVLVLVLGVVSFERREL